MTFKNDTIAESRTKLDGGLNTRDNPFQVRPDKVVDVQNFRAEEGGSLKLRDAAKFLATLSTTSPANHLSAPTIVDGGAGSIPAATYTCRYHLTRWGSSSVTGDIGPSANSTGVAIGASRSITIRIFPNNLGEAVGLGGSGAPIDDPFMGGYASGQVAVYLQSGAGSFEFQGLKAFTWDSTNRCYTHTLSTYTTGQGTSSEENSYLPVRKLFYYDTARAIIGVMGDTGFSAASLGASGVPATPAVFTNNVDKNSNTIRHFSRSPTPIDMTTVNRVVVATDGFRPKKLQWAGTGSTSNAWRMLGANPPDATPTAATNGAGALTGAYSYRVTFIYLQSRAKNALPTSGNEEWYSESRPVTSNTVTAAGHQLRITFSAANRNETGLGSGYVAIYRTKAGGSTYYFVQNVGSAAGFYDDNATDASLGTRTDPDDEGKEPCDVPPQRLILVSTFGTRCVGVVGQPDVESGSSGLERVIAIRGTNQVRFSKPQLATYTTPTSTVTSTDWESSVDHWPNNADHTVACGDDAEITALVANYRGLIYVFKHAEIGVISGKEPGEFEYSSLYTEVGSIRDSVVNVSGLLYFWNAEKGAYTFDGRSYQWIGYGIQDTWLADRDANPGYYCVNAIHDPETNEVRWSFTNAGHNPASHQLDATQSNLTTVRGSYKEYVYNLATQSWWPFVGASQTRDVRAACLARVGYSTSPSALRYRVIFGTTIGTLCMDHETGANAYRDPTDGSSGQSISAHATLRFAGLLDDWDFVKDWDLCFVAFTMGTPTSGSLIVKARAAQSANFVTVATITAATVGQHRTQMIRLPDTIGDNINVDRGLQVRFESTVNCALSIHGVELRYKPVTPIRAEVRP